MYLGITAGVRQEEQEIANGYEYRSLVINGHNYASDGIGFAPGVASVHSQRYRAKYALRLRHSNLHYRTQVPGTCASSNVRLRQMHDVVLLAESPYCS